MTSISASGRCGSVRLASTSEVAPSIKTIPRQPRPAECCPIPDALLSELSAAKARQAAERLALGEAYAGLGYVVCNEAGEPYHPSTLSTMWQAAIKNLDVPQVRLHDARHTCATLMHLQGVPIALVAAWLGHADVSFTLRTYVHAQPEALELAARSFAPADIKHRRLTVRTPVR